MKTLTKKKSIESMTKEEARIAICKDVLRHLRSLRVKSGNGYLVDRAWADGGCELPPATDDAQKHVGKITKRCEVCALGGMMLSFIRLFDDVPMKKLIDFYGNEIGCERDYLISKLKRYFTPDQLYQIEYAFEHGAGLKDRFNVYSGDPEDDKNRLRATMLNVIRNGGKFVPYEEEVMA